MSTGRCFPSEYCLPILIGIRGLQKLANSVFLTVLHGARLGDFLLAPACPIEKVALWVNFHHLFRRPKTSEGVAKDLNIESDQGPRTSSINHSFTLISPVHR